MHLAPASASEDELVMCDTLPRWIYSINIKRYRPGGLYDETAHKLEVFIDADLIQDISTETLNKVLLLQPAPKLKLVDISEQSYLWQCGWKATSGATTTVTLGAIIESLWDAIRVYEACCHQRNARPSHYRSLLWTAIVEPMEHDGCIKTDYSLKNKMRLGYKCYNSAGDASFSVSNNAFGIIESGDREDLSGNEDFGANEDVDENEDVGKNEDFGENEVEDGV